MVWFVSTTHQILKSRMKILDQFEDSCDAGEDSDDDDDLDEDDDDGSNDDDN